MNDQIITINGEKHAISDLPPATVVFVRRHAELSEALALLQLQVTEHQVLVEQYSTAITSSLDPQTEED